MLKCRVCAAEILPGYMGDHLLHKHGGETDSRRSPMEVLAEEIIKAGDDAQREKQRHSSMVERPASVGSPRAQRRSKPTAPPAAPIGHQVLSGLAKGEKWVAEATESCGGCRRRIVFLRIDRQKYKAFDVARDMTIVGIHVCNETAGAGSVYACSGGIIDSNRRRH
jgi:hypothetical protein